jgi:hypothetical protein
VAGFRYTEWFTNSGAQVGSELYTYKYEDPRSTTSEMTLDISHSTRCEAMNRVSDPQYAQHVQHLHAILRSSFPTRHFGSYIKAAGP